MQGFIYICRREHSATGLVKIGCTDNLERRMDEFRRETGADSDMIIELAYACELGKQGRIERAAHALGKSARQRGEWFSITVARAALFVQRAGENTGTPVTLHYDRSEAELAALRLKVEEANAAVEAHRRTSLQFDKRAIDDEAAESLQMLRFNAYQAMEKRVREQFKGTFRLIAGGFSAAAFLYVANAPHSSIFNGIVAAAVAYGFGALIASYFEGNKVEAARPAINAQKYPEHERAYAQKIQAAQTAAKGVWDAELIRLLKNVTIALGNVADAEKEASFVAGNAKTEAITAEPSAGEEEYIRQMKAHHAQEEAKEELRHGRYLRKRLKGILSGIIINGPSYDYGDHLNYIADANGGISQNEYSTYNACFKANIDLFLLAEHEHAKGTPVNQSRALRLLRNRPMNYPSFGIE